MSTVSAELPSSTETAGVDRIGSIAGAVWSVLEHQGVLSQSQLVNQVDAPRDLVMQAVGWLAREDKLVIEQKGRRRTVALK